MDISTDLLLTDCRNRNVRIRTSNCWPHGEHLTKLDLSTIPEITN